jgi:hypothetical protein
MRRDRELVPVIRADVGKDRIADRCVRCRVGVGATKYRSRAWPRALT